MITITQLIAVLFKVITIITMNPNIPQDVKDSVIVEITQAISQENQTVSAPTYEQTSPVASPVVTPSLPTGSNIEPVVEVPVSYEQGEVYVKSAWILDINRHDADRVEWKVTLPNNGRTQYRVGHETNDFISLNTSGWEVGMDSTIEVVSFRNGVEIGRYTKEIVTSESGLSLR